MMTVNPKSSDALRSIFYIATLAMGILTVIAFHYPGCMDADAKWQLQQGRTGYYDDGHPPVMAWIWGRMDSVVKGPLSMLLLHNILFWFGVGTIVPLVIGKKTVSYLMIMAIGMIPSVFSLLGAVWKDVSMGTALLFAFSMLLYAEKNRSRFRVILAVISLCYGCSVRHNAFPAVFPLAMWAGAIICSMLPAESSRSGIRKFACGLCVFMFLIFASFGINKLLVPKGHTFLGFLPWPTQQIFVHDLVGVSISKNEVLLPEYLNPSFYPITVAEMKNMYDPRGVFKLFWGHRSVRKFRFTNKRDETVQLVQKWVEVIPRNLKPYMKKRTALFKNLMGADKNFVNYPFCINVNNQNKLYKWLRARLHPIQNSIFFRGWLYFLLNISITFIAIILRTKNRKPTIILGLSGILYILPFFMGGVDGAFRYNCWSVFTAVILPVLFFSDLYKMISLKSRHHREKVV